MDLWVVGAAAAAGYIAKHWQKVARDKDTSISGSKTEKLETPSCPIRRLTQKKKLVEDTSKGDRFSDVYRLSNASEEEVSSSGHAEMPESSGNYDESNVLLLSSLQPEVATNTDLTEYSSGNGQSDNRDDSSFMPFTSGVDSFHKSRKKTSSLWTKHMRGHLIKPLNSLESCLMAQLYTEHAKMEEYVLSVFPSPSTKMRPLLITDGNKVISRSSDYLSACTGTNDISRRKDSKVYGVPPLPEIGRVDVPDTIKSKTRIVFNKRFGSSQSAGSARPFQPQDGSLNQTHLFILGISVGIVSSLLASRREVDKLQDQLKQTENLVLDLQEELEMKDSLTVKELADENCERDTCETSLQYGALNPILPPQNADYPRNNNDKESQSEKAEENSEDISKIEAELEAELERLGIIVNTSSLEQRLSDLVELDPDFEADFAQGDLRSDMGEGQAIAQSQLDRDKSCTPTTHDGNYAVSPRELSLRLHEVIESRLEEHVKQLEIALGNSQRKVQLMESERKNVWRKLSSNELKYSSGEESPTTEVDFNSTAEPLVMNLSGEALDAYNEAYEELMKIDESEEDDSPPTLYENSHQKSRNLLNETTSQGGVTNGSITNKKERESYVKQLKVAIEHSQGIQKLLCDGTSDDDNSSSNDEMEKRLIKQIVEKTRKGSPMVVNAQRVLFSMDN